MFTIALGITHKLALNPVSDHTQPCLTSVKLMELIGVYRLATHRGVPDQYFQSPAGIRFTGFSIESDRILSDNPAITGFFCNEYFIHENT